MSTAKKHTDDLARLVREGPERLVRTLERMDDVQVAAQVDNLSPELQDQVLQALEADRRPAVLDGMRYEQAALVVRRLAPEAAAEILDELESDDVVDILGRLDREQIKDILTRLDAEDADEIQDLLTYEPNTAGGIMAPAVIIVHDESTVAEALREVRQAEDLPEQAFLVHVVDDDGRLVGVVTLRALVVSPPDSPIRGVMDHEVVAVQAETDQEEVADVASRYDLVAVPVVDAQHRLLGIVTIDDIVDVLREEATEDILKFAGAGELLVDTRSFWASFRARVPWLGTAAFGGLLVAIALSGFENALKTFPALALFMPVVAGMGGNVGTQSSTIVVRGIAVGYIERAKISRLVLRETTLGAVLGLIYGTAIAMAAPWVGIGVEDPWKLGLVITFGMVGSMTIAGMVGASVPLALNSINVDPAIATGPFVTTAVDILGLLFYFWLATLLMGVPLLSEPARTTPAVILRTHAVRESDLVVILLTPQLGRLETIGRGARKSKRRFPGGLTVGARGEATVARGRGSLQRLDGFMPLADHAALGRDLMAFAYTNYMCEVTDQLVTGTDADPRMFAGLCEGIEWALEGDPEPVLLRAFELRLLDCLGLLPTFGHCCVCGEEVQSVAGRIAYDATRGGALCPRHGKTAAPCDPAVLRACEALLERPRGPEGTPLDSATRAQRKAVRDLTLELLRAHLRRPLKSLEFFAQLPRQTPDET